MKVNLISYSQPTSEYVQQGIDDAQELITRAQAITTIFPLAANLIAKD